MEVELIKDIFKQYNILDCIDNVKRFLIPFNTDDIYFSNMMILKDGIETSYSSEICKIDEILVLEYKYHGDRYTFIFNKYHDFNISIMELLLLINIICEKINTFDLSIIEEFMECSLIDKINKPSYDDVCDYNRIIYISKKNNYLKMLKMKCRFETHCNGFENHYDPLSCTLKLYFKNKYLVK